jgi:protein TonB
MRIFFFLFFLAGLFIQSQAQIDSSKTENVHIYDQINPQFPGGDTAFAAFIRKKLIYPEDARRMGLTGVVFVGFYVETDGSLSDIKVVKNKGLIPSCDQAAIDVLSKSPKWKPGEIHGVPTTMKIFVRVKFNIER